MDKKTFSPTRPVPTPDLHYPNLLCLAQFAQPLRHRECSPPTLKNYLVDLRAFAC